MSKKKKSGRSDNYASAAGSLPLPTADDQSAETAAAGGKSEASADVKPTPSAVASEATSEAASQGASAAAAQAAVEAPDKAATTAAKPAAQPSAVKPALGAARSRLAERMASLPKPHLDKLHLPKVKLPERAPKRRGELDMSVSFAGVHFNNPVIAASGTFGYGVEFEEIVTLGKLGGFVVKGISREPMAGNPTPRLFETPAGMINAVGLQNIGVEAFLADKLPELNRVSRGSKVIVNVFGHSIQDYEAVIRRLNEGEGVAAYELNVSCPNVKHGGMAFGQDPIMLQEVVSAAKLASARPLIVKLSPNVASIAQMAVAAQSAGADAISLVNTFTAMCIDVETRKPQLANVTGGLSGPAIRPIAVRMVYEAAHAVDIPVIGLGGVSKPEDVIEFMLAGAAAVEVGTANFWDPRACERIVDGLERWCLEHRIERITDLIGGMIVG